jgi:peptidyl-prolyl cis-trans isomerase B (cyclophilin B)
MTALKIALLCLLVVGVTAAASAQNPGNPLVVIDTNHGAIKVELFQDKAPLTVKNILEYVDAKHYDGTVFHRVIGKENSEDARDFMIQGGGFDGATKKEKETKGGIKNEAGNGLSNARGTLAMARTGEPDSATAQFYINVGDNTFLDRKNARDGFGYTVFGRVVEGMDVVDRIKAVRTGTAEFESRDRLGGFRKGAMPNVPVDPVVIKSIRRADKK